MKEKSDSTNVFQSLHQIFSKTDILTTPVFVIFNSEKVSLLQEADL